MLIRLLALSCSVVPLFLGSFLTLAQEPLASDQKHAAQDSHGRANEHEAARFRHSLTCGARARRRLLAQERPGSEQD